MGTTEAEANDNELKVMKDGGFHIIDLLLLLAISPQYLMRHLNEKQG